MSANSKNHWSTEKFLEYAEGLGLRAKNRDNKKEFRKFFKQYSKDIDTDPEAFSRFCSGFGINENIVLEKQLLRKHNKARRRKAGARAANSTTQSSTIQQSETAPWKKIIWVAYPDNPAPWNVKESKSLCVEILTSNREMDGLDWLDDEFLYKLPRGLRSFCSRAKDTTYLHQGLATMLIAKSMSSVPIELQHWSWLEAKLRAQGQGLLDYLTDDDGQPEPAVIILHCTTAKPRNMLKLSREIERLPRGLVYSWPGSSEIEQDLRKRDWEILDEIAASSIYPEYRFRPRTCPGRGTCRLSDKRVTFAKREHSNGGAHTACLLKPDRGFLQCDLPHEEVEKESDPDGFSWHHQQYIDSLDSREFRVQITMENDPNGTRGVRGRVTTKVTTKPSRDDTILSKAFDASDLMNEDCGWYTEEKLDAFALWIIDRLLGHPCATKWFGSLQVGVRLDIGFCHGFPFVNEIVRPYSAHWFSLSGSPEPFIRPCKAVAVSLLRHLHCLK